MALSARFLEPLTAALLAVNNYPLEKAYSLLPQLREAGLTNPGTVVGQDERTLFMRLRQAGYDRGALNGILADRLHSLMAAVDRGDLDRLPTLLSEGRREDAVTLLCRVKGIGRSVALNACMMLEQR